MPRPTNLPASRASNKPPKKRPAPSQSGPKSKKIHLEKPTGEERNENLKTKKRSQPVTAPVRFEDDEEKDDEDEGEDEDEFVGLEDNDEGLVGDEMNDEQPPTSAPKDPNASRESHKVQKHLQAHRRSLKPHSDLLTTAKKHWSLLHQKSAKIKSNSYSNNSDGRLATERKQHLDALMGVLRGNVKDIVMKHDASRIVQSVVKWGGKKEREEVAGELVGSYRDLVGGRYSKFLVSKIIRLCPTYRPTILREFQGHVLKLLLHREASSVLADAFELYANAYERSLLVREFYGPEGILVLHSLGVEAEKECAKLGLKGILNGLEADRRKRVLGGVKENLTTIFNNPDKGAVTHAIVHRVLWEYLSALMEVEDAGEREKHWREIFEICQDVLAEMVHTKDGSRVVREFIARGSAKDRKQILKVLKPHIERMCTDEEAQLVLFTALDTIDDTKLLAKSVIEPITAHMAKLYPSPHGRRTLLYLLVPRTKRHFTPAQIATLGETDALRAETSKKDAGVREEEVRKAASGVMIEFVEQKGAGVVLDPGGSLLVLEVMLYADGDKSGAMEKLLKPLAAPYPSTDLATPHPIDLPHTSRMYKTLLQGGHFSHSSKSIERASAFSAVEFAKAFVEYVGRDAVVGMAKGDGAFVVAELCERLREEGEEDMKGTVRRWFGKGERGEIEEGDAKGKKVLLGKLGTL